MESLQFLHYTKGSNIVIQFEFIVDSIEFNTSVNLARCDSAVKQFYRKQKFHHLKMTVNVAFRP